MILLTFALLAQGAPLTVVSAATYQRDGALTPAMIVTAFSTALDDPRAQWQLVVQERTASAFTVAANQASFVLPADLATGETTIQLRRNGTMAGSAAVRIANAAPGLFTANSNGAGAPAGIGITAARAESPLFQVLEGSRQFHPRPLEIADGGSYLTLYGTGFRRARAVRATLGGEAVAVAAAIAHPDFAGLDQVNVGPLPAALAGRRGDVDLVLDADGVLSPPVRIALAAPGTSAWARRAELLEANSEMSVVELGGRIYVLGGYPASRVTVPTVQVYDIASNTWSLTAPLPVPVNHSMAAAHEGKLYLMGGQTDANTAYVNAVQIYDPATRAWTRGANMPTARSSGAAVVMGGKIYVAGGRPPRGADFAVYDPARDEWQTLPDLPTQRNHLAAVAWRGRMYVIGGRFEGGFQSRQSDAVEIYDPSTGRWTTGAMMPEPRGGLNAVEAYGCIHVFGGEFATGVHGDHDVYDPVTNRWLTMPEMPTPVHGVTGAVFRDGLIYLPGGGTSQGGSSGSRIHQVYRPGLVCAE